MIADGTYRAYRTYESLPLSLLSFAIEPFGESTVAQKCMFELPQLLIEQIARLMDQTNDRIRGNFRRQLFNIGPVGNVGPIMIVSQASDRLSSWVVLAPQQEAPLS